MKKLSELEKALRKRCVSCRRKVALHFRKKDPKSSSGEVAADSEKNTVFQISGDCVTAVLRSNGANGGSVPEFVKRKDYPFEVMGSSVSSRSPMFHTYGDSNHNVQEDLEEDKEGQRYPGDLEKDKETSYFNLKAEENLPMDFFKHTSIHGLKYIGERKQHVTERIFWIAAFVIGLIVACYMIGDVWKKYLNNSVIINFAPYNTKIEQIPFPAITICSMNKVLKSKANFFMQASKGSSRLESTKEARENLYYLNHVCSSSKSFTKTFNYAAKRGKIDRSSFLFANKSTDDYDGGKEDLWKFFLEASPSCSDMILKCIWQGEIIDCGSNFKAIETDYGKCCVFNMINPSQLYRVNTTNSLGETVEDDNTTQPWEWDGDSLLKSDYDHPETKYPDFPRRQKIPGKSFGLSVLLNPDLDEYFCTTSDSVGFRLVPHLPIDVPHISDLGSAIKPDSEVFINIRPEVTTADKASISNFSPDRRECYFNEEHKLAFYSYYSPSNCIDECIANLTKEECRCRRHYQPGDDTSPLCGPKQFHCASSIKRKFVGSYKSQCKKCIPTCTEIAYHTETTYTKLQAPDILWTDSEGNIAEWAGKNVSIVHIYFGEGSINAKKREEMYGTVDLIANVGGLMGLCLGFSGLSLIEVLYFLTLRAWCKTRKNRRAFQSRIGEKIRKPKKNSGMSRSDTATGLLSNEHISCVPVYDPPNAKTYQISKELKSDGTFQSLRKKKAKSSHINHILYTVAFASDRIPEQTSDFAET